MMLLACGCWVWFLHSGSKTSALAASICIALAHAMKFTALLLWPILLVISVVEIAGRRARWRDCVTALGLALVITFVVVNAAYGFWLMGDRLDTFEFRSQTMQTVQRVLPGWLPVPFHRDMVRGFDAQKWEAEGVYVTTLFGEAYFGTDWRYYPYLVLCKTTLGGLVLLALGAASMIVRRPSSDELPLLILAAGVGLGMMLLARMNIGIRYLLPLYAPTIILLGRCVRRFRLRPLAAAAVLAIALEAVLATPRFVSFTNVAVRAGGLVVPHNDSGQSLIELRDWMSSHQQEQICLLYLGTADPRAYGIGTTDPFSPPTTPYVAITRALLDGLPVKIREGFAFVRPWRQLRWTPPVADLGGLLVYRTSDLLALGPQPWVVHVHDWQQALQEPTLIKLRNFDERALKGD